MQRGVKFQCFPTGEQAITLAQWMGCARVIYNAKCAEDQYYRSLKSAFVNTVGWDIPVDQEYSRYKDRELTPYLFEVPSQILRNSAYRWRQAYQRFFAGVASGRPRFKCKGEADSVWLTGELFCFEPVADIETGEQTGWRLVIGTQRHPVGELLFNDRNLPWALPKSVTVSRQCGKWYVSFSYVVEDPEPVKSQEALLAEVSRLDAETLFQETTGIDRGITIPVQSSDGASYLYPLEQIRQLERLEHRIKKWQRKLARQQKGSRNRAKIKKKLQKDHAHRANIRRDFCHKASTAIVEKAGRVIAVEDLKLKNMTARPDPKQDESGKYIPNGAAAKSGLNKSLLNVGLGQVVNFIAYKAEQASILLIKVNPYNSSRECAECGHTHKDNRPNQATFICQECGHQDNADHNAARVIRNRAVEMIGEGKVRPKAVKRVGIRRKQQDGVGGEPAEPQKACGGPQPGSTRVGGGPKNPSADHTAPGRKQESSQRELLEAPTTAQSA